MLSTDHQYPQDIQWLKKYIKFRCIQAFTTSDENPLKKAKPSWLGETAPTNIYQTTLQAFTQEEGIVLLAAMANQVYPVIWEAFGKAFDDYGIKAEHLSHLEYAYAMYYTI